MQPKTVLSWGHVVDKIKISNNSDHDWFANDYNISRDFRDFQTTTIDQLKKNPTLSYAADVDEIFLENRVTQTPNPASLPVSAQLNIMEYSTLLTDKEELDVKWHHNWSKWDPSMTKEERSMFDCVQLVTRNFFLNLPSDSIKNVMDEDTFVHRYCHLMFEELFNMNNLEFVWANGESNSSKERRKSNDHKHGRKPDFRVLFDKENEITFGEIKPPSASNNMVNQALIKLAEFMKGSLDSLHKKYGYSQASETFGIIIGGSCIKLFSMDIPLMAYTALNRLENLLKSIDHSIDELNRPSTPTGLSYHRESNSTPFKVHIPILKIPASCIT
ncbi:hypothetical protein RclHR1_13960002 [Rhizophagus clarus]|uniref:Uncharacterized protein n=1 Tax=Rhizophagus clarus TaxID=94130 RepID=A0A2Z6QFU0_9GLOM|nr:hypothetical protein RclHR1_13960002 [Rhizophagus clarus]